MYRHKLVLHHPMHVVALGVIPAGFWVTPKPQRNVPMMDNSCVFRFCIQAPIQRAKIEGRRSENGSESPGNLASGEDSGLD